MADELEKQIADEEKLYSEQLSKTLTDAVNSKDVIAESDELNGTSSKWPHAPSKELNKILTKAMMAEWSKKKRDYASFKEDLTLEHKKGKKPEVTAKLKYDGEFKGGKSVMLKPGDTVVDLAKSEYGHECYAAKIWEENDKVLGTQCKVLPAGFGLELPKIWVPKWVKEPKVSQPPGASSKAEDIKLPNLNFSYSAKAQTVTPIPVGAIIIEVTCTISGDVKVTNKGILSVGVTPQSISAGVEKMVGPFAAGYEMDLKANEGTGGAKIRLFSKQIKDLTFTGDFKLASGGIGVQFGVATVKQVQGDLELAGSFKASATVKIYPNPRPVESEAGEASVATVVVLAVIIAIPTVAVVLEGVTIAEVAAAGRTAHHSHRKGDGGGARTLAETRTNRAAIEVRFPSRIPS